MCINNGILLQTQKINYKQTMAAKFKIERVEDILRIDIMTGIMTLKEWGVDTAGLKEKKTVEGLLIKHFLKRCHGGGDGDGDEIKNEGISSVREALQCHRKNREKLMQFYDKVLRFYKDLPANFQQDLDSIFPDIERSTNQKRVQLLAPECNILVTGEATAGKSSLINLLLQADILPTSDIKCTQTICEIRKSKDGQKRACCFEVNGGKVIDIDISTEEGKDKLTTYIKYEDEYGDNPFEKIEIYWPTDAIEEGLVIIDTPGFGDNHMHKSLKKYLTKSCGFIYVVNTANAGGVQRGRLTDFLRNVVNSSVDDFNPAATLFVCNKWDVVPIKDRDEIKRGVCYRLEQIYQGLRPEQIFYFSTMEAKRIMEYGALTAAHKDLISNGLDRLFPASLRQQLNSHYRWLSQILKRANYTLKVSKTMAAVGKEDMKKTVADIERNMNALVVKSKHTIEDLKKGLQFEISGLHRSTVEVLRSQSMLNLLTDWNEADCPPPADSKKLAKEAAERIASRVSSALNKWERENKIIHIIKDKMIKKFKRDCELLEDQITEIEGTLVGKEDKKIIRQFHASVKKQAPVKSLWKKGKTDSSDDDVRGLGGAVGALGSAIGSNKKFRGIFKKYKKKNNDKKMSEATVMFVQSVTEGKGLVDSISNYLGKLLKGVDDIAKKIPEFLKADRQLVEKMSQSLRETDVNLSQMYPQLIHTGHSIQGGLDLFFVFYIMEIDYQLSDIEWNRANILGSGSFADVYQGSLERTEVALKYCKQPLSDRVVSDILLEDRTLRELKHEHIISYYGCTLQQIGPTANKVHWIMIMERCDQTLKSKFLDSNYDNPAKVGSIHALQIKQMGELARYALQICSGLGYLHKKELVHRDIKLENILIVKKDGHDIVKLTDVGLMKREDNIGGSIMGSPVYMAPEVLVSKGIYDRKVDIYALGIVLWEMWYGIDAAEHIQSRLSTSIGTAVVTDGMRPSLTLSHKPDERWQGLITACWDKNPDSRPDATRVETFFEQFLRF